MVDPKLLLKKEASVEVLDFRDEQVRNLFSEYQPDQALQKIKNSNSEDNFNGYSRPFKLVTIPHKDDLDFLIKGNNAKNSRWYIWEKLLSESNLNLEIIVLFTGELPNYKIARNKLYLPEFLTEKRIRLIWTSSLNGIFWSPLSQNYPSALLHWNSKNVEEANFQALIKPLTILEVFDGLFNKSKPGEIYNPGLRQAAFGTGYEKESKELLETFCMSRIRAKFAEELAVGKPWTEDEKTYFTMKGLQEFLKQRGFTLYNRPQIQQRLKDMNDGNVCNGMYKVKDENGNWTNIRVWWVPKFKSAEVEIPVNNEEEFEEDVPF